MAPRPTVVVLVDLIVVVTNMADYYDENDVPPMTNNFHHDGPSFYSTSMIGTIIELTR